MFNKLVRESGSVYKAEYERDRLSRDWHPDPHWSWFVFIAGDSECEMWGFLTVNHKFKGGYGFLLLTEHARGGVVDVPWMQKSHWRIFKLNFSKACFMSYFRVCSSCRSFIRVTSAIPDCMQCMPWRSFPFWGNDYSWCNQSHWSLLGLTAWNGPHWVLQQI